jgi:hypothetical protein
VDQNEHHQLGGSLEKSLAGQVKLDLIALGKEAWQMTHSNKSGMLQASLFMLAVTLILISVLAHIFVVPNWFEATPEARLTLQVSITIITTPFLAAMLLLGIAHSVGKKPSLGQALQRAFKSSVIIVLALLLSLLVNIGLVFLLVPGIYFGLASGFAMMLVVEKGLAMRQAIMQSLLVFNRYWLPISVFYGFALLLLMAGTFTFGLAYIWIIPFYFNFKGVLYRELFGITVKGQTTSPTNPAGDSIFHA